MTGSDQHVGMLCPVCGSDELGVTDSRPWLKGSIKRRRGCKNCGKRWSTIERALDPTEFRSEYPEPHVQLAIHVPVRIADALKNARNTSSDMRVILEAVTAGEKI